MLGNMPSIANSLTQIGGHFGEAWSPPNSLPDLDVWQQWLVPASIVPPDVEAGSEPSPASSTGPGDLPSSLKLC